MFHWSLGVGPGGLRSRPRPGRPLIAAPCLALMWNEMQMPTRAAQAGLKRHRQFPLLTINESLMCAFYYFPGAHCSAAK